MSAEKWHELLKFRCTGCGNCCRETVVCISTEDVERIVDGTGKSPEEFVDFFPEDEVNLDKRNPLWVRFTKGRAVMALRWKRNRCVFLTPDDQCSIYEHRPVTCRQHPFEVTLSKTGAVERLALSRVAECLYESDGKVTRRSLRALLNWNEREADAYSEKVKTWNRRRRIRRKTYRGFLDFLGLLA